MEAIGEAFCDETGGAAKLSMLKPGGEPFDRNITRLRCTLDDELMLIDASNDGPFVFSAPPAAVAKRIASHFNRAEREDGLEVHGLPTQRLTDLV